MADNVNDNHAAGASLLPAPDAYGQAAFLLAESMLHALVAQSVLTVEAAAEVVDIAADVKADIGAELGDPPMVLQRSLVLLRNLATSVRADQKD